MHGESSVAGASPGCLTAWFSTAIGPWPLWGLQGVILPEGGTAEWWESAWGLWERGVTPPVREPVHHDPFLGVLGRRTSESF